MTYPVTPNPTIHNEPPQITAIQKSQTVDQLRTAFAQLPWTIVKDVVNAILTGLGLSSDIASADAGLAQLQAAFTTIGDDLSNLTGDGIATAAAWNEFLQADWTALTSGDNWTEIVAALQTSWNAFALTVGGIEADETLTIEDILNTLIPGLFPSPGSDPTGLTTIQTNFTTFINDSWTTFLSWFGITPAELDTDVSTFWTDLVNNTEVLLGIKTAADNALTPSSPLNTSNLFGWLPIPSTTVVDSASNLLWNAGFDSSISLAAGGGWSWDSAVYYSTSDGDDTASPGCALVIADGTLHALNSNPIPVSGNQVLPMSVQIMTLGLTGTGTPLQLNVIEYLGNTQVAVVNVAQSGAPTGGTTAWVDAPTGAVAGQLSGTYTVPDDGTVDGIRVQLAVTATATGGPVRFDHASASLTGGLISNLQSGLTTLQDDNTATTAAWNAFLQADWHALTTSGGSWSTMLAELQTAWNTFALAIGGIEANATLTIESMMNLLIPGLFPTVGGAPTGLVALQISLHQIFEDLLAMFLLPNTGGVAINLGPDIATFINELISPSTPITISAQTPMLPPANVDSLAGSANANLGQDVSDAHTAVTGIVTNILGGNPSATTVTTSAVPDLPASIITSGTFAQSMITDLATDLTGLLGTTVFQSLLDGIANAMGHTGTGHTVTNIETYLGIIPATNLSGALPTANLPTSYANINTDLQNLFNDVVFAAGRGWTNIGADVQTLVNHLIGTGHTVTVSAPTQVPHTAVASVGTNANLGADVTAAQNSANTVQAGLYGGTSSSPSAVTAQVAATQISSPVSGDSDIGVTASNAHTVASSAQGLATTAQSTLSGIQTPGQGSIPQTNIKIDTSTGSSTVSFDAAGSGGYTSGNAPTLTATGTHTVSATANYIIVAVSLVDASSAGVGPLVSVTSGSEQLIQLGNLYGYGTKLIGFFGLFNPAPGSQTISVSVSPYFTNVYTVGFESASYKGVGTVSGPYEAGTTGYSLSQSIAGPTGSRTVQAFSVWNNGSAANPNVVSYNQTVIKQLQNVGGATYPLALTLGDALGSGTVSFTANTGNTSSYEWSGAAVSLAPSGASVGSGMRQYRVGTTTVTGASSVSLFPDGFFDSQTMLTSDLTYTSVGNKATVSLAGWYMVRIAAVMTCTVSTGSINVAPVLYKNGSPFSMGDSSTNTNGFGGQYGSSSMGSSFIVYCNAGDNLQAGYVPQIGVSGSMSSLTFTGESSGIKTYFEITLMNRSLL